MWKKKTFCTHSITVSSGISGTVSSCKNIHLTVVWTQKHLSGHCPCATLLTTASKTHRNTHFRTDICSRLPIFEPGQKNTRITNTNFKNLSLFSTRGGRLDYRKLFQNVVSEKMGMGKERLPSPKMIANEARNPSDRLLNKISYLQIGFDTIVLILLRPRL